LTPNDKIEALTDALIRMTEFGDPESKLYRYRNPLGLRVFCKHGRGLGRCEICPEKKPQLGPIWDKRDWDRESGLRIFRSLLHGYEAAVADVTIKCSGKSGAAMGERPTLEKLCIAYAMPGSRAAEPVAKFLRKALGACDIKPSTELGYFLEDAADG
jgi:hypothetical protein